MNYFASDFLPHTSARFPSPAPPPIVRCERILEKHCLVEPDPGVAVCRSWFLVDSLPPLSPLRVKILPRLEGLRSLSGGAVWSPYGGTGGLVQTVPAH